MVEVFIDEREKSDKEMGVSPEQKSLKVFINAANSIIDYLEFTGEVSEGRTKKIPCLDTEMWYGRADSSERWYHQEEKPDEKIPGDGWKHGRVKRNILYTFYSKPMANPLTMLKRSAVPEGMKISTAVQEVLRRWKNTSEGIGKRKLEEITSKYMDNLTAMGFDQKWREKVLKKALVGYKRVLSAVDKGDGDRNRAGAATKVKRGKPTGSGRRMTSTQSWKTRNGPGCLTEE